MNSLLPTNEPVRVTLRHIRLAAFVKWYTLAFAVLGIFVGALCTAWYMLDGQLKGRAIAWYFLVTALFYAIPGLFGSIIFAVIYNYLAGRFGGGLQFDIVAQNNSLPPAPPERW